MDLYTRIRLRTRIFRKDCTRVIAGFGSLPFLSLPHRTTNFGLADFRGGWGSNNNSELGRDIMTQKFELNVLIYVLLENIFSSGSRQ